MKDKKIRLAFTLTPIAFHSLTIFFVPYLVSFLINGITHHQAYFCSELLWMLECIVILLLIGTILQQLRLHKTITSVLTIFFYLIAFYSFGNKMKRFSFFLNQQRMAYIAALKFINLIIFSDAITGIFALSNATPQSLCAKRM
ncbi:hypothetical protein [Bartonella sp. cb54]|uniref:hypothetical protein n=1 Tax=Bartonella sp. cb54 TaxID=3385560 RepID=UPI0039A57F73